jgi:tryptophan-rich sensory protein
MAAATVAAAVSAPNLLARAASPEKPRNALWYAALRKPYFTPPQPLIPLVWTAIEAALAWGAYRILRRRPSPARTQALVGSGVSVAMIGGWSLIFFGRKSLGASTAAAALMVGSGVYTYRKMAGLDRKAAATLVPFVAWTGFATLLTATIWRMNRR